MNLFVKKILVKYVKYIEIIGYSFVLLFIAGLVALSFIKAEDEFVHLNGNYEITIFVPELKPLHGLVAVHADSFATVEPGAPLFEITEDAAYCTGQAILSDLRNQADAARANAQPELAQQIESILHQHPPAPPAATRQIHAEIAGEFLWLDATAVGGVFDFAHSTLRVSEFPPDRRQKKQLEPNQTGTATFPAIKLTLPVKLVQLTEHEAVFAIDSLRTSDKIQLAAALAKSEPGARLPVNLAVHVGWRSWMQLIWR
jgi:hypothetical protein